MDIPPLRERKEDIPYLVEHFAKKFNGEISESALERLMSYHWPGNVRELENVVERSILLARAAGGGGRYQDRYRRATSRPAAAAADGFLPEGMSLDAYEQHLIREALKRANGNKSQAARLLGLTRNALRYRLDQMGLGLRTATIVPAIPRRAELAPLFIPSSRHRRRFQRCPHHPSC